MVKSEWCHDPELKKLVDANGGELLALGTICMCTHDSTGRNAILTGWLASQSDMLLEDWGIYKESNTDKIDTQIEENERRDQFAQETRAVIEAEVQKRAEKIIKAKDLRCRNCTRYQKHSAIKDGATIFWCPPQNKAVFGNDIACVNIDPCQDVIDKIKDLISEQARKDKRQTRRGRNRE